MCDQTIYCEPISVQTFPQWDPINNNLTGVIIKTKINIEAKESTVEDGVDLPVSLVDDKAIITLNFIKSSGSDDLIEREFNHEVYISASQLSNIGIDDNTDIEFAIKYDDGTNPPVSGRIVCRYYTITHRNGTTSTGRYCYTISESAGGSAM